MGSSPDQISQPAVRKISSLPQEILIAIFDYLTPEDLSQVVQSSRELYKSATSSCLWERFYFSFWKEDRIENPQSARLNQLRNKRRIQNLYHTAQSVWNRHKTSNSSMETPFPEFLTFSPSTQLHVEEEGSLDFYKLFCARIRTDEKVIQVIKEQCINPTCWFEKVYETLQSYGDDVKDILIALIVVQKRVGRNPDIFIESDNMQNSKMIDFPSALQSRKPSTYRSKTHSMVIQHLGEMMLQITREQQAIYGLNRMWAIIQEYDILGPSFSWTEISATRSNDDANLVPQDVVQIKQIETVFGYFSMICGGEGQEISNELDKMAVACSLFLADRDTQSEGPKKQQKIALAIYEFLKIRQFRMAKVYDTTKVYKNFIHCCLSKATRETHPMTFSVLYCAIACRLGLFALRTCIPDSAIIAIRGGSSGQDTNFWLDVEEGGLIYDSLDLKRKFRVSNDDSQSAQVSTCSTLFCCLSAARNIERDIGPVISPFMTLNTVDLIDQQKVTMNQDADEIFELIMAKDDNPFNPSATYFNHSDDQMYLVSAIYPKTERLGKRLTEQSNPASAQLPSRSQSINTFIIGRNELENRSNTEGIFHSLTILGTILPQSLISKAVAFERRKPFLRGQAPIDRLEDAVIRAKGMIKQQKEKLPPIKRLARSSSGHTDDVEDQSTIDDYIDDDILDTIHPVGTVFVHRTEDYHGVITVWNKDYESPNPIFFHSMEDDATKDLPRKQPFYWIVAADNTTRYVAHVNIQPASVCLSSLKNDTSASTTRLSYTQVEKLRKVVQSRESLTFSRVTAQKDGSHLRFELREEMLAIYPDEIAAYKKQIKSERQEEVDIIKLCSIKSSFDDDDDDTENEADSVYRQASQLSCTPF
ncbi:uncharacterized protein FA14DRAFT_172229 [Meira miltonrushii]|uniref:F-box domain-containing protein n=1 Tax=Meira miltonrushii TaxID=1280837 RepID=A0A316VDJ6_9BASI|nr:uncharacterized protein FA14DRAFT_172229 [Meira miltonrushii]PWN35616.1 hypothetical protein FA14DRAFT_172229 [Meira miltonrushii]